MVAPNEPTFVKEVVGYFSNDLELQRQEWKSDRLWTDGIQRALCAIGHKFNFRIYATKARCPEADDSEWLYDHTWVVESDRGGLTRLPLAAEIEWGFGEATMFDKIKEDFLKLAQSRAELRVMVFQNADVDQTTDRLIALVEDFDGTSPGDRYLFAGWSFSLDKMICRYLIA